ncbi:3-isopropylmalate dehydratase [Streptomyces varsoviensis]|uniref:LeuD/DmdB family oxidoreductase small subunit n=1 Tax=Streptomyces varsoviensis TaxID=67373 RepID=UPI00340DBD29
MSGADSSRVIRLGDNIDTDIVIPTQYMTLPSVREMARYAFSPIWPDFAEFVRPGDIIVAGRNFGSGSSREQAPEIIKELGIRCVVAVSFSRLFYRNALNNGLLVIESSALPPLVDTGSRVAVDLDRCVFEVEDGLERQEGQEGQEGAPPREIPFGSIPHELMNMVAEGGLVAYWSRVNAEASGIAS